MTSNQKNLAKAQATIDSKKVEGIVIDALQEILPHIKGANTAEIMMAYAVMMKSTLIGMELSDLQKEEAKVLFDRMWPQVLVNHLATTTHMSTLIH